jgi:hypothetical protein
MIFKIIFRTLRNIWRVQSFRANEVEQDIFCCKIVNKKLLLFFLASLVKVVFSKYSPLKRQKMFLIDSVSLYGLFYNMHTESTWGESMCTVYWVNEEKIHLLKRREVDFRKTKSTREFLAFLRMMPAHAASTLTRLSQSHWRILSLPGVRVHIDRVDIEKDSTLIESRHFDHNPCKLEKKKTGITHNLYSYSFGAWLIKKRHAYP